MLEKRKKNLERKNEKKKREESRNKIVIKRMKWRNENNRANRNMDGRRKVGENKVKGIK